MASLKEIKGRIASVNSTLKITSAMKMVASAKLHRAQAAIENMLPYERRLDAMLSGFLAAEGASESPYAAERETERVAIVAVSSNSSLCGAFNANAAKMFHAAVAEYERLGRDRILVFPVGRKIADAVRKEGFVPQGDFQQMIDRPEYKAAAELAGRLMKMFADGEVDRVELVYNHFKSSASQVTVRERYLPVDTKPEAGKAFATDYIVEPGREEVMRTLIPQVLSLKIYTMLLDSNAAEHAARTVAMQMASDNATELLQELTVQYNKSRQQAITNELLDMMGAEIANG
ncbi:F0F1 ATP synthase subunit gamma [uncultured Alistipes sp.]|uniref:F0F1 ATP synthase subunit gamma n=1 Tax=uncultured Alistipes sp. TaxID=538949 RepID=UPI00261AD4F1|nr:F0F1 ATP synthase subunit gamma [uncultured Alistipes sp.]